MLKNLRRLAQTVTCVTYVFLVSTPQIHGQVLVQDDSAVALRLPNIILLIADDLGYGELGCQGNPEIPTPCIDELAASGVRCTQAYVTAPNCSPSRAGLFTGRIPTRFGYEFNPIGARNEDPGTGIPKTELMLAEQLRKAGYGTALIGKWHLGGLADFHPLRRGFDEFFGFLHEGHYYVPPPWEDVTSMLRRRYLPVRDQTHFASSPTLLYSSHMGHDEPPYDANNPILRGGQPVAETEYLTDALTRESVDFIQRHRQHPFFLCVAYNAVHSPLQAKNDTLETFSHIEDIHRRIFAAMLSDLDTSVGKIVDTVQQAGLRENTLILFLSDNGGPTRELTSSNSPLRDGKGSMYEGGLRVPFIASWPGTIKSALTCDAMVSSLDIFPTLTQLSGIETPTNLDGRDLLPTLNDLDIDSESKPAERAIYWRQGNRAALRRGDWKIVASGNKHATRKWELFNISTDLSESTDLADSNPHKLRELVDQWEDFDAKMSPPRF
jgi:arylsulfatase A-like enzyme